MVAIPFALKSQIVVGYYYGSPGSYPQNLIEYNCLTHIAHAFLIPDSSGSFSHNEWFLYPELIKSAHDNGKKIVVSLGGWGGSDGFKPIAADPVKRASFIDTLVKFIVLHKYDGADIDWEYPKKEDKENFNLLVSEMRAAFDSAGIEILSAALPAIDWHNVFDAEFLKNKFNWFGIMTYDFYGPWEKMSGLNTALYSTHGQFLSVDSSMKHWQSKGVPLEKLCMGMEFAGYLFNTAGLYNSHKGAKSIRYTDAMNKINSGWNYNWNETAKVPYLTFTDSLITIDDTSSIRYKSEYILKNKLAGTIIWKSGLDYRNGYNEFLNIIGDNFLSVIPGKPDLLFPGNKTFISDSIIHLKWSRPIASGKYIIEISEQYDFSGTILKYETNTDYLNIKPDPFKVYYWRVCSENLSGKGDWSEVNSFFTYSAVIRGEENLNIYINSAGKLCGYFFTCDPGTTIRAQNITGEEVYIMSEKLSGDDIYIILIAGENIVPESCILLINNGRKLKAVKIDNFNTFFN